MSVKMLTAMIATVTASFAVPMIVQAAQERPTMQTTTPKPIKTGHAAVNGVNYYYAVYGTGEPLLLLHGGLGQIEMFGPNLTKLAQNRQVIGVDLQGHGRTPLGDRELSLVDMGNDMAGVLKKLGYDKVDVLGYSMGGGVAFQFAAQHPEMVRRLALVSPLFAGRILSGDAAAAGSARRCDGGADEGNADVQVVRGDRAASGRVSEAARPDGCLYAQAVRLVGGRQETDHAGDAHLRRQRHVPRSTS
jgi:pimeloyl-ACP methyl ester carboxylesterase